MFTDTTQIADSLVELINYNWADEMSHFQEEFEVIISSQDTLEEWIDWCQKNNKTTHIFYHLMVLKAAHPDLFDIPQTALQ